MNMKINLNIIKISIIFFLMLSGLHADYTWERDVCETAGCKGCSGIKDDIQKAAKAIDDRHEELEKKIAEIYQKDIIDANIKKIDTIQAGITKSVAHIRELEHAADIESKELIFILRKNKALYSLPVGAAQ